MTRVSWYKKGLVVGIIVLLIGVSVSSSTGKIDRETCQTTIFNGSLLGYVNDTSGNPIEGALVIVFFHDNFRMDFSDEDGYYHVTDIPICYCMKDVVCSKSGYKSELVSLAIAENTVHDFILTPKETITSSLSENEDCIECKLSDGYGRLKVNLLLTRIKTINNIASLISRDDEKLKSDFPISDRPLCDLLLSIYEQYRDLWWHYAILYQNAEDFISFIYYYALTGVYLLIWIRAMSWYLTIGCDFPFP